ncbi:MAG: Dabb family protein [Lachnospiraceae bacterium]|nr:Dabb family protein [Lachnospiraceae bacterium]
MVYHIVMWNFKKEIPEEKKTELKASMAEHLQTLVGQVPGLLSVKFVEEPIPSSTHEMALVTTMEKVQDVAVYGSHPAHVAVANTYVRPYVCDRSCLDYEA